MWLIFFYKKVKTEIKFIVLEYYDCIIVTYSTFAVGQMREKLQVPERDSMCMCVVFLCVHVGACVGGCSYLTHGQLKRAESERPTAHCIPNLCVVCHDGWQYTITPTAMPANMAFIHRRSAKGKLECKCRNWRRGAVQRSWISILNETRGLFSSQNFSFQPVCMTILECIKWIFYFIGVYYLKNL